MSRVLVIDDDPETRSTLTATLRLAGYAVETAETGEAGLDLALSGVFDVILSDMRMPGISGIDVLRRLRERLVDTALIIMTGFGTIESAVEAMKLGAVDFVQKPFFAEELLLRVKAATERRQLARQVRLLEQRASPDDPLASLVGESEVMERVRDLVRRAATLAGTVLITGETGTGKELVARAIHAESTRADRPFVVFNCAAVSGHLIEQALFGHMRGSFPGATADRPGLIEHANLGTLCFDEISLLARESQARLLAVLESGIVRRIGENDGRAVDVRFVAATNTDLRAAVEAGTFRQDLYYRLNAYHVHLPPLRERPGDVETLLTHFIRKYSPFDPREVADDARQAMLAYHYPGNVRELEHIVQRALALAQGRPIQLADLPESVAATLSQDPHADQRSVSAARDRAERAMILGSLASHHGDLTEVAHELQVSRTTLWRLMRKHGIRVPD
jgi:two-component system response regulator HydG